MKHGSSFLALGALLAGCSGGEESRIVEVPPNLRQVTRVVPAVTERYPFAEVSRLRVGQWARYAEGDRTFTLAVVGKAGEDVWIELIEERETREVSARLVSPGGIVRKALFREISPQGPSDVVEQRIDRAEGPPARPAVDGSREGERVTVKVGGRDLACRQGISWWTGEADGRRYSVSRLWSPEVPPVYEGSEWGGLVRRKSDRESTELVDFGTDARPLVPVR
ncbi:MAG TPA: hypothetical protein VEN81_16615 [Planctomycetota bacterium]|nr:hypothetical protein [Planctomycetota bacterium]